MMQILQLTELCVPLFYHFHSKKMLFFPLLLLLLFFYSLHSHWGKVFIIVKPWTFLDSLGSCLYRFLAAIANSANYNIRFWLLGIFILVYIKVILQ